ncbi:MAG: response regulator transcription factor [Candidatus Acidiferrales bacterium]
MSKCLLLADDNALVRRSVRNLLTTRDDWKLCEDATDGSEAVERVRAAHPDLAILDYSMPRMNGLEAARRIADSCPQTLVLLISAHDPTAMLQQLMEAGVRGFVSKYSMGSHLIPAIEALLEGRTYFETPLSLAARTPAVG